jgi:hypothetical protein
VVVGKQRAKLLGFFIGKRRECQLRDAHVHKDHGDTRWIRLSISMPLSQRSIEGMPEVFADQFALMEKEDSAFNSAKNEFEIEGATITIYPTDTMISPVVNVSGGTLQDFRLAGEGVKDQREVSLEFTADVPYSVKLREWCDDHLHATFFAEIESSQMEIAQVVEEKKKGKSKQQALPVQ